MNIQTQAIEQQTRQWLQDVVIGLQLCPFAKAPLQKEQISFFVSQASSEEELIEELIKQCHHLDAEIKTETTLIICANLLDDFFDFCQFLTWANSTLKSNQWQGVYQLANFHPHYTFSGCEYDDPQNLTNRAPFPILHLLREESLTKMLEKYPEPELIPKKNIEKMHQLSIDEQYKYFSYLFKDTKN
jgi:hypothetical protein